MDRLLFDAVGSMVAGMVPAELGAVRCYTHGYGIKVWFDTVKAPREHYEAQVLGRRDVSEAKAHALEVGFHAEHPQEAVNQAVLDGLLAVEKRWRKVVGKEAEMAVFLGRAEHWRRVSEIWLDPDLDDPELAFEVAARLTDYITAIEPARRHSIGG